jgi:DNA-binding response OmpR family regulator
MARLLLIEDDIAIRRIIATSFQSAGFEVIEADTGTRGIELLHESPLDLAIIDLRLPDMSGIDVVRTIRPTIDIPLVILTAYSNTAETIEALTAGADDFLSKPIDLQELLARAEALLRRYVDRPLEIDSDQLTVGDIDMRLDIGEVFVQGVKINLTKTEFNVLYELLRAKGTLVSKAKLLDRVWGYDYLGETRLVDTQIYRLRAKLVAAGVDDFIMTVRGRGYRIAEVT